MAELSSESLKKRPRNEPLVTTGEKGKCVAWNNKKKRACGNPTAGHLSDKCFHHIESGEHGKRMQCSLGCGTMVYENRMAKHLRVCTKKKREQALEQQEYFAKDVNLNNNGPAETVSAQQEGTPTNASGKLVGDIISKLDSFLALAGVSNTELEELSRKAGQDALLPDDGVKDNKDGVKDNKDDETEKQQPTAVKPKKDQKHSAQEQGIIDKVCDILVKKRVPGASCVVEMGAGKGRLSMAFAESLDPNENEALFIIVDRNANRHQLGANIKNKLPKCVVNRIRIDIKDFALHKVPEVKEWKDKNSARHDNALAPMIMASKHLCGEATCHTLRCAVNMDQGPDVVCIALCCHHVLSFENYIDTQLFTQTLGLGKREFDTICRLSCWATNGSTKSEHRNSGDQQAATLVHQTLSFQEKKLVGLKCKRLLNQGRLRFLESHGYNARLEAYCDSIYTPENTVLMAWPKTR